MEERFLIFSLRLFQLSEDPNPLLQPVIDALEQVRGQGDRANISETFNLKQLIGEDRLTRYYRYDGSLTTPPCFESVVWTVAIDPLKISFSQLRAFQSLHDSQIKLIQDTYRPIQRLGTRILFRSFASKDIDEDARERKGKMDNHGEITTINMNLFMIILGFFFIRF